MSNTDETCEYVLDPDDPETWGGEIEDECWVVEDLLDDDGVWTCPHRAKNGEDLCIFHLPVAEKDDREVVDAFLNALDEAAISGDTVTRQSEFLGAKFGTFDLSENPLDQALENERLAMNYAEISGTLDWSDSMIDATSIRLNGINCSNDANFGNIVFKANTVFYVAEFAGRAGFNNAEFKGVAGFYSAEFGGGTAFKSAVFFGEATFERSVLGDNATFEAALFNGEATFEDATLRDYVNFNDAGFGENISFQSTVFKGNSKFERTSFLADTNFSWAEFKEVSTFENATFEGDTNFDYSTIEKGALMNGVSFESSASFNHATFSDSVSFKNATFEAETTFGNAILEANPSFTNTLFGDDATFIYTTFTDGAIFAETEFGGDIEFNSAQFEGSTIFIELNFGGNATFDNAMFADDTTFENAQFEKEASFGNADFEGDTTFENAEISSCDFEGASLIGAELIGTHAQKANFREAHLENVDFDEVDLSGANLERTKLSNADLFGTDLSGVHLYGARIGDAAINTDTVFDKHGDFRCVYDPNSEYEYNPDDDENVRQLRKAMGAYHVLEQLTRANTLPDEQAKFFARRQDMRRAQLREDGRRLNYWFAEAQNAVFRHGESFSRVVGWSVGTIIAFAFLYPIGGWLNKESPTGELQQVYTYDAIIDSPILLWESFNHSALLFLTGGGPLKPVGFIGEVLTTIEALIAPILLALLVFVLGRRAAR